ncbi:Hypothetical predicted protein [Octopus vulgaris]|uniref:ISXO2-like transposase domain-containing protein n=1 Tax=Octopus vulgaris TaxID=6645 RepID=A0AA36B5I5_OCTVU|nr:Hypothetical predicted protein [Octopus vulgaris]
MIGGDGVEIEIDERVLVHRKYQRGRIIKTVWLFGGLERLTKRSFMVPLLTECDEGNGRDADTLVPIIRRYVRPRSIIYSDCWHAYSYLRSMGYTHYQVNHSKHFVDPHSPAIHTQNIERLWKSLKKCIVRPEMRPKYHKQYVARLLFIRANSATLENARVPEDLEELVFDVQSLLTLSIMKLYSTPYL